MTFPRYPAYKPSGVEWLGEVPEHWNLCRTDAVIGSCRSTINADALAQRPVFHYSIPAVQETGDGQLEDGSDIDSGKLVVTEPQVLVSKLNPRKGTVCIAHSHDVLTVCSSEFVPLLPRSEDIRFLWYIVQSENYRTRLESLVESATKSHQRAAPSDIYRLMWSFPPRMEQTTIATFLDRETAKIDALIAEQQRLIELLKEKRQAVISHAVTKGPNPDAPMKNSGVEWLGEVPEHWTVMPLRLAARIESGHTPSRSREDYWVAEECIYPWFTLGDVWQIRDGRTEYVFETQEKVSQIGLENSAARLLPANTVVLSRTASVGFSGILGAAMATTQDFVNWICGPRISPEYLLYVFRAMVKEFERLKYGSTHNTIYMPDIFSFRAPVPPLDEQREIVSMVRESLRQLDGSFDDLLKSQELLQERRSALISAAVTGQIDVRGLVAEAGAA